MSMRTGSLGWTDWTSRCDDLKTLFATITGLTFISDTGTGNTRVLLYSVPGTNKQLKVYFSTNHFVAVLKADNATTLANSVGSMSSAASYRIIENGNLVMFLLYVGTTAIGFMWSKTGTTNRFFIIGANNVQIHSTNDVSFSGPFSNLKIASTLPAPGNKQLVFPYYPYADIITEVCDASLDNVYVFGNKNTTANLSIITINSDQYLLLDTNGLLKIGA